MPCTCGKDCKCTPTRCAEGCTCIAGQCACYKKAASAQAGGESAPSKPCCGKP